MNEQPRLIEKPSSDQSEAENLIGTYVHSMLGLGRDDYVSVNEIGCSESSCEGGAETFIRVVRKGQRSKSAKVARALLLVTLDEAYLSIHNILHPR